MAALTQISLEGSAAREIEELANTLHKSPEATAAAVVANGLHVLRRYAFYRQNAGSVSPERGLEILDGAGKNNSPDPGDELPEDLK